MLFAICNWCVCVIKEEANYQIEDCEDCVSCFASNFSPLALLRIFSLLCHVLCFEIFPLAFLILQLEIVAIYLKKIEYCCYLIAISKTDYCIWETIANTS